MLSHEPNDIMSVGIDKTLDSEYVLIQHYSKETTEVTAWKNGNKICLRPREDGVYIVYRAIIYEVIV